MGGKVKKIFGLLLAILILLTVSISYSFAKDSPSGTDSADIAEKDEPAAYVLVYPGMLPDNPLYFLKSLRDGFIGLVISDPNKKAEFDLLQADKMIGAGSFLVRQNNKQDLAIETIEKGHSFFADAIVKNKEAEKRGVNTNLFFERLSSAAEKHEEVIRELFQETKNEKFQSLAEKSAGLAKQMRSQSQSLQ